jgi:BirA family biotin operon repressor/biotin-[acetyl-CoA-carboxylase] ligase
MSRRTEKPFWDPDALQAQFETQTLGKRLIVFNHITSTNDFLKRLARRGAEAGTLVLADLQTAGRGRLGRPWQSPPGVGLWFSMILRPKLRIELIGALPLAIAAVVAETLSAICEGKFSVKWPNDILWNQRKVCGILCEAQISPAADSNQLDYVIAGIGINVNQQSRDFYSDLSSSAISLRMIADHAFERQKIFLELVRRLDQALFGSLPQNIPALLSCWRSLCLDLGKTVRLRYAQESVTGIFEDIGVGGELVMLLAERRRKVFSAGEVSIIK